MQRRPGICFTEYSDHLQLEEKIREKVNEEFRSQVSLQEECDLFLRYGRYLIRDGRLLTLTKRYICCYSDDPQGVGERM